MSSLREGHKFSTRDEVQCVKEMVKGILILDHSKKPFTRKEMRRFLSRRLSRRRVNEVITKSRDKLKEMGLKLVRLKDPTSKSFFLTSNSCPLSSFYRHASDSEVADRTLLVIVLAFIFMNLGLATDEEVLKHLEAFNIYSEEEPIHDYFGDAKKKIFTDFVNELYLEKTISLDSGICILQWGERAEAEVTKRSILEFVCNVGYGAAIKPRNLASHYAIMEEEETQAEMIVNGKA